MSKKLMFLCTALVLGIVAVGCARRESAAARVKLPAGTAEYTQVMSYAQSPAFAEDVQARAAKMGLAALEIHVQKFRDTSLLELRAISVDPQSAAQAANLMATMLTDFAVTHKLGEVELVDRAVAPSH